MLGLENPLHIAIVLLVVLMVFGAKRLPEMGKSLGSGLRGFKDSLSGDTPSELSHGEPAAVRVEETEREHESTPVRSAA